MRHLNDGLLRRLVDEPSILSLSQRGHMVECVRCRTRYDETRAEMLAVTRALAAPSLPIDTAKALAWMHTRIEIGEVTRTAPWKIRLGNYIRTPRLTSPFTGAAAGLALIGAVTLTPAGSLAQQFTTVFRPAEVTTVPITQSDLATFRSLTRFGTVRVPATVTDIPVRGPSAAATRTGMTILAPSSLPGDIPSDVQYHVVPAQTGTFTFSAAKARHYALVHGATLGPMPQHIDGSILQVTTGTAVVGVWGGGQGASLPSLVVGQMKAPHVSSTSASVTDIENYVLSLPGVSSQFATAIRSIGHPATTLPLPIPVDLAHSHQVTVQGVRGVAIGDATGLGSVVVWEKHGIVYGVGGALAESETLSIAESLK